MKKLSIMVFAVMAITACSDEPNESLSGHDIADGIVAGISSLNIDFTKPVVYKFSSQQEQDAIIASVTDEIYEVNVAENRNDEIGGEFSVDLLINKKLGTITVTPIFN